MKSFWLSNGGEAGQTLPEASTGGSTVELTSQIPMPQHRQHYPIGLHQWNKPIISTRNFSQPASSLIPRHRVVFKEEPTVLSPSRQLRESTPLMMSSFGLCEVEKQAPSRAGSEMHKMSSDFGVYQNGWWDSEEGEQAKTLQLDTRELIITRACKIGDGLAKQVRLSCD